MTVYGRGAFGHAGPSACIQTILEAAHISIMHVLFAYL